MSRVQSQPWLNDPPVGGRAAPWENDPPVETASGKAAAMLPTGQDLPERYTDSPEPEVIHAAPIDPVRQRIWDREDEARQLRSIGPPEPSEPPSGPTLPMQEVSRNNLTTGFMQGLDRSLGRDIERGSPATGVGGFVGENAGGFVGGLSPTSQQFFTNFAGLGLGKAASAGAGMVGRVAGSALEGATMGGTLAAGQQAARENWQGDFWGSLKRTLAAAGLGAGTGAGVGAVGHGVSELIHPAPRGTPETGVEPGRAPTTPQDGPVPDPARGMDQGGETPAGPIQEAPVIQESPPAPQTEPVSQETPAELVQEPPHAEEEVPAGEVAQAPVREPGQAQEPAAELPQPQEEGGVPAGDGDVESRTVNTPEGAGRTPPPEPEPQATGGKGTIREADLPIKSAARSLHAEAQMAGLKVSPSGSRPLSRAVYNTTPTEKRIGRTVFEDGEQTEYEISAIIHRIEHNGEPWTQSHPTDYGEGLYLIRMRQAEKASDHTRPLVVANGLMNLAKSIVEPSTHFEPFVVSGDTSSFGELVPNTVRKEHAQAIEEGASRLIKAIGKRMGEGSQPLDLAGLEEMVNPQARDPEAGGEFGHSIAAASIRDAAKKILANESEFTNAYQEGVAAKNARADSPKPPPFDPNSFFGPSFDQPAPAKSGGAPRPDPKSMKIADLRAEIKAAIDLDGVDTMKRADLLKAVRQLRESPPAVEPVAEGGNPAGEKVQDAVAAGAHTEEPTAPTPRAPSAPAGQPSAEVAGTANRLLAGKKPLSIRDLSAETGVRRQDIVATIAEMVATGKIKPEQMDPTLRASVQKYRSPTNVTPPKSIGEDGPGHAMGATAAAHPYSPQTIGEYLGGKAQRIEDVVKALPARAKNLAETVKNLNTNETLPSLSKASGRAAEQLIQHVTARDSAKPIARHLTAQVLGDRYKDEGFSRTVAGVLVEDRLRGIKGSTNDQAGTIVGATYSPFKTEADFQAAIRDPDVRAALDRWKQYVQGPAADVQSELGGRMAAEGPHTGTFTNLLAIIPEQFGMATGTEGVSAGRASNARQRGSAHNVRASGTAETYSLELPDIIENTVGGNLARVNLKHFYDTLQARGLAVLAKEGTKFVGPAGQPSTVPYLDGKPGKRIDYASVKAQPNGEGEGARPLIKHLWVRPDIYSEVRNALNLDSKWKDMPLAAGLHAINSLNLKLGVDGLYHMANQISALAGAPQAGSIARNLVRRFPGLNVADALSKIARARGELIADTPEVRARLADLAKIGALKPEREAGGSRVGKLIESLDRAGRLAMDKTYTDLVKAGIAKGTPAARREFVNQLGQYNSRLQHFAVRALREVGASPFVTAGQTFNVQGIRRVGQLFGVSTGGVRPASAQAAVRLRVTQAATSLIGAFALTPIINYMTTGQAMGRPGTPIGAIDTGLGSDEKPVIVDPLKWTGLRRGLRITGLGKVAEGVRYHRTPGQILDDSTTDIIGGFSHPFMGPAPQAASVAMTGKEFPSDRSEARAPAPGDSQAIQRFVAALQGANPLTGAGVAGAREGGLAGAASSVMSTVGSALGIRQASAPNDAARHRRELMEYRMQRRRDAKR